MPLYTLFVLFWSGIPYHALFANGERNIINAALLKGLTLRYVRVRKYGEGRRLHEIKYFLHALCIKDIILKKETRYDRSCCGIDS